MPAKSVGGKRPKAKLGDIVAIPMPDGQSAFARIYRSSEMGVFPRLSEGAPSAEEWQQEGCAFFVAGTDEAIRSGEWPVVANVPFATADEAWAPPKATWYLRDLKQWTTGSPRITYRDEVAPATVEQVAGLDIASFCQTPELIIKVLIDRLVLGNHDPYVIPRS
jgi:hypothetical protein